MLQDLASAFYLCGALRLPAPALHAALQAAASATAAALKTRRRVAACPALVAAAAERASQDALASETSALAAAGLAEVGAKPLALLWRCLHAQAGPSATDIALQRALQLPPAEAAAAAAAVLPQAARMQQHEALHNELLLGLCLLAQHSEASPAALVNSLHACGSVGVECADNATFEDAVALWLRLLAKPQAAAALRLPELVDVLQALLLLHARQMRRDVAGCAAAALRAVTSELHSRHRGVLQQQLQQAVGTVAAAAAAAAAAKGDPPASLLAPAEHVLWITAAAKYGIYDELLGSLMKGGVDCKMLMARASVLLRRANAQDGLQHQQFTGRHVVNLLSAFSREGVRDAKVFLLAADLLLRSGDSACRISRHGLLRSLETQDAVALLKAFGKARMLYIPLMQASRSLASAAAHTAARPLLLELIALVTLKLPVVFADNALLIAKNVTFELLPILEQKAQCFSQSQALTVLKALNRLSHPFPALQQELLQLLSQSIIAEAVQRFSLILPEALRHQLEARLPPETLLQKKVSLGQFPDKQCPGVNGERRAPSDGPDFLDEGNFQMDVASAEPATVTLNSGTHCW
ncbi:hypothetical protein cyc_06207 [Cyclospora cayetanensis]|uniref:Uncharacterized protein n=1 Tax=Cyclospora cayetanensis TaxID=88456 RepID=A0A1D3D9U0_9EIME|nr:hypothetical protein cyc_06207 [Cyclospora cayetanensis]